MGLDTVELLLDTEAHFGVTITDEAAAQLTTPRMLASHVAGLLAAQSPEGISARVSPCLNQRAFYRLRRALIAESGLPRDELRPTTPLATLFPDRRAAAWRRLRHTLAAPDLPRLTVTSATSILAQIVGTSLSALLGTQFPSRLKTLGDLVPYIPVEPPAVWREGEILQQVCLLTGRISGLALEQIDPDAHFVHDLGLD